MKTTTFKLALLLFLLTMLLMMPLVAAGGPIHDYDYDEGPISGSWTEAEVTGWWDPPDQIVYNIYHDSDYDFAQGYWCTRDYEQHPLEEPDNDIIGWTRQKIYVYKDGDLKETVESLATIPYT